MLLYKRCIYISITPCFVSHNGDRRERCMERLARWLLLPSITGCWQQQGIDESDAHRFSPDGCSFEEAARLSPGRRACTSTWTFSSLQPPLIFTAGCQDVDVRCCTVAVVPVSDSSGASICFRPHKKKTPFFLSFWWKTCKALSSTFPDLPRPRNHSFLFFIFENYSFFWGHCKNKRGNREARYTYKNNIAYALIIRRLGPSIFKNLFLSRKF